MGLTVTLFFKFFLGGKEVVIIPHLPETPPNRVLSARPLKVVHTTRSRLVFTAHEHGPWKRVSEMTPVFTARVHGWRLSYPWTRAPVHTTRVHGPCSRSKFLALVAVLKKALPLKKALHDNAIFNTGREHGPCSNSCPHYPCSRAMFTPVNMGRDHG